MFDLSHLGIYPDAINDMCKICEDAIQDVKEYADLLGYNEDVEKLNFDFSEDVLFNLEGNIDVHNITNSVIGMCLWTTKFALEGTQFCEDFGFTFEGYTNCDDSHLYFVHNGLTEEYHGAGDMDCSFFFLALSEKLTDIIRERLLEDGYSSDVLTDEVVENIREVIENDLVRKAYDNDDIVTCYRNHEITGTIKEMVDSVVPAKCNAERKVPVERD